MILFLASYACSIPSCTCNMSVREWSIHSHHALRPAWSIPSMPCVRYTVRMKPSLHVWVVYVISREHRVELRFHTHTLVKTFTKSQCILYYLLRRLSWLSVCSWVTPRGAGVPPFRLCSSLVHSLPLLLLFITFPLFLFSFTLLIFFYCPSDPFLPE